MKDHEKRVKSSTASVKTRLRSVYLIEIALFILYLCDGCRSQSTSLYSTGVRDAEQKSEIINKYPVTNF